MKNFFLMALCGFALLACADKEKQQEIQKLESETVELKNAISKTKEAVEKLEATEQQKIETLNHLDMAR